MGLDLHLHRNTAPTTATNNTMANSNPNSALPATQAGRDGINTVSPVQQQQQQQIAPGQQHTANVGRTTVSASRGVPPGAVPINAQTGQPVVKKQSKIKAALEGAALAGFAADEENHRNRRV